MGWQEIVVAGLTGLGSGTLAALATPWAKWKWADKPQRREDRRLARIEEWREGINALRAAEEQNHPEFHLPGRGDRPPSVMVADAMRGELPETKGRTAKLVRDFEAASDERRP